MADTETRDKTQAPDDVRMTIGEHLEELRTRVIRCLAALIVACIVCIWPAKYLLQLLTRPVALALRWHGQPENFLATSPVEPILTYVKVVVIAALVLASPYILHQLWGFVAAGLYPHERRWVNRLWPTSLLLFLTGVAFMYTLVLLVSLNFLVGFGGWLTLPQTQPNTLERLLLRNLGMHPPDTQPAITEAPVVSLFMEDPADPPVGRVWFNLTDNKLKLRGVNQTYSVSFLRDDARAMVTTHFRLGDYLSFVLLMIVAFGLAFQIPLVVLFLARSGIVPLETMRKYRKIVILLIVFVAGILAPPDLLSHLLLSGPMLLLFELGIWLAARRQKKEAGGEDREQRKEPAAE